MRLTHQHRCPAALYSRGMTLIEVLVALAVFATVSVMAFGGLNTVLKSDAQTRQFANRLGDLQMAITLLERDLNQTALRPVRDEYGELQPPILGGAGQTPGALELTRTGRRNPTGMARSSLQRIHWRLEDGVLERSYWTVLDRAQDSLPHRAVVIDEVLRFDVRFLGRTLDWVDAWPELLPWVPSTPAFPLAVEITIELEDWGPITRLFALPSGEAKAGAASARGVGGEEDEEDNEAADKDKDDQDADDVEVSNDQQDDDFELLDFESDIETETTAGDSIFGPGGTIGE